MEKISEIYQTIDYSKFKFLTGNRKPNKIHVHRLKESFKDNYLLSPITVNENYEIIDGQHRFEAAKELELPINYYICQGYKLREVQILNTNMVNWTKLDYLDAFCDLGYKEYLKFRNFMNKHLDFGLASCEYLILGYFATQGIGAKKRYDKTISTAKQGVYFVSDFKNGNLVIPDEAIEKADKYAEMLKSIKPYFASYNSRVFVGAMCCIFKKENYDHERFLKKLKKKSANIEKKTNIKDYRLLIEDIYNLGEEQDNCVSLRF